MNIQDVIALTPPASSDGSLAAAACRAGARGFLDLENTSSETAAAALARMERFAGGNFGVKLGRDDGALVKELAAAPSAKLAWVLLVGGEHCELETWIGLFRNKHIEVF